MSTLHLRFELHSYWHPGTGKGSGSALDAITHRDSNGLPSLPGRTVKGLLRDAVQQAADLTWYGEGMQQIADQLFGWRPKTEKDSPPKDGKLLNGCLRFSDATLPELESDYLQKHSELLPGLYREHFSTAVEHQTCTAKEKSLRGMEVIVPLNLYANITQIAEHNAPPDWQETICTALPLIQNLGSQRNRGMGRVLVCKGQCQ